MRGGAGLSQGMAAALLAGAFGWPVAPLAAAGTPEVIALPPVLVTARRKEESAVAVPISMVALDGESLAEAGFSSATDLPERVAGLTVSVPNPRLTSFTIRGLGSNAFNDGVESSVGLFMDGVYLGRQGFSIFDLVDLERIEVLRGPQGTLFGKNTTAGAIHILTRLPSHTFGAQLDSSLGTYGSRQVRGSVTGPLLDDQLAGRLTGYLTQRDGLLENRFDGTDLNNRDKSGLRGQLLWTPHDALSGRFIGEYGRVDEDCCAYPLRDPIRPAVNARDDYMEYRRASGNPADREADSDAPTTLTVQQQAASAEFGWTLSPRHRLVSLSAWRDWRFVPQNDDATSLKLVTGGTRNAHQQRSQELRLESRFDTLDTVLGLFYLHQDIQGMEIGLFGEDLAAWTFGGLLREQVPFATRSNSGAALDLLIPPETLDGMTVVTRYAQDSRSVAGFGTLDWSIAPDLDLSLGLRYTDERKQAEVDRRRSGGNPNASVLAATNALTPLGTLIGVDLSGVTFAGLLDAVAGGDFSRADQRTEGNYSGQAALRYQAQPDLALYVSAARGYKGGGINLGVTGERIEPTFSPETATAFEVGAKSRLFGQRMALAVAFYHTDVEDYQALTFDEDVTLLPNPRLTNLLNVGQVRLQGVELEASGALAQGLLARAGLAYNRAITRDFRNAPDEDTRENTKDLSGRQLFNAPRWSGNVGFEYVRTLGAGLEAQAALDYAFRGGSFATLEQGRASYVDGYTLTNLRLGVRDPDRTWELGLWVRNLFDADYVAVVQPVYGVGDYGALAGDPRTYGVTLRLHLY